jgi:hypothetical protein
VLAKSLAGSGVLDDRDTKVAHYLEVLAKRLAGSGVQDAVALRLAADPVGEALARSLVGLDGTGKEVVLRLAADQEESARSPAE